MWDMTNMCLEMIVVNNESKTYQPYIPRNIKNQTSSLKYYKSILWYYKTTQLGHLYVFHAIILIQLT